MVKQWICGQLDGKDVNEFEIANGDITLRVMEYGATIHTLCFDGVDCVAGYEDLAGYVTGGSYQGATVGRYANRIGGASFSLNGKPYKVDANDNEVNSLHGGATGFSHRLFAGEIVGDNAVAFSILSPDGEGGYPGNLHLTVTFTVEENAVTLRYDAKSDEDTVMNFTNHAYFTLGGEDCRQIDLRIAADAITPVDELLIPTGELLDVTHTPFDFRTPKPIGRDMEQSHPQLVMGGGYDHNFVLGQTKAWRERVITAEHSHNGIGMHCSTDLPGVQLYTSNMLDEPLGKGGNPLVKHQALCLETQFFPDSPNQSDFPSCAVKAGESFTSITQYKFYKI